MTAGAPEDIVRAVPSFEGEPVFQEPWQARIFAVVSRLAMDGRFPWDDFKENLIAEIGGGGPDDTTDYYIHFAKACENLLTSNGMLDAEELEALSAELKAHPPHPNSSPPGPITVDKPSAD